MSSNEDLFREVYDSEPQQDLFEEVYRKPEKKIAKGGKAALRGLYKAAKEFSEIHPLALKGPVSDYHLDQFMEKHIGDPEAGFAEKTIERGVQTLPYLFGGEGAIATKLGRAGIAAILGQATEEAGGPPLLQAIVEGTALSLPGFGKKIASAKAQKSLVDTLRKRGLSEKEIAPLIPSELKIKVLGGIAKKGGRGEKAVKKTQKALGNLRNIIVEEAKTKPILATPQSENLKTNLTKTIDNFPEEVAKIIRPEVEKKFRAPIKFNDLVDLWEKINDSVFGKRVTGKKRLLNNLKDDLMGSMKLIDPELASDFQTYLTGYTKLKRNIEPVFKPSKASHYLKLGKIGSLITSIVKKSTLGIKGVLLIEGSQRAATELLVNPRLQNLSKQMISAVNNNKFAIAKRIQAEIIKELEKKKIDVDEKRNTKES